ncbi:cation:proton antiporter domain-containing protein [Cellulomonas sp. NPDC055163]
MDAGTAALVMFVVFAWGLLSARLGRADLSAPVLFVAVGFLLSEGVRVVDPHAAQESARLLAEVTLVWVLFADASRVRLRELRADLGLYTRLLAVGLPLTVAAGTLLAAWLVDGAGVWLALLVGAALAPTDAALGAAVMSDPAVPARVRRVLNVESGLNDGIVTPVVMLAIAGAATAEGLPGRGPGGALLDLAVGVAVGAVVGGLSGRAMRLARRRGWASEDFAGPGVLALALAAYAASLALDGNGFVAAFVTGLAFGSTAGRGGEREVFYVEQTAGFVSLLTWLVFGAVAVPTVLQEADGRMLAYAVLSLTVVRMVPVRLALLGAGLAPVTTAFLGWFGPRGLASIIFALIAMEELDVDVRRPVAVIGTTVLLSVLAHGLSARPLADRYAAAVPAPPSPPPGGAPVPEVPVRGLPHRHGGVAPRRPSHGPGG